MLASGRCDHYSHLHHHQTSCSMTWWPASA